MRGYRTFLAACVLGAAALCTGAAQAGVVIFDNFNSDTPKLNWKGDTVFTSTAAPGSTDLVGPSTFPGLCAPGQGNCVDLDGSTGSGHDPAGQLTSVDTVAAGTYTLQFLLSGNQRGAPAQSTTVSLGNFSTTIPALASSAPASVYSFTFHTTGGNLVFTENGPSDNQGNLLDNVSLATTVPEPATWAMMLIGVSLIGAGIRVGAGKRVVAGA